VGVAGETGDGTGGGRDGAPVERRRAQVSRFALYRPALIAACIGIVLSVAGAFAVFQWENRLARAEFEGLAENQAITIQNGINEYVGRLITLRTLFESANEDITRSEYETFSQRLFQGHPGLLRVAWVPRVSQKERPEYEAAAVADGVSGYQIKSFTDGTAAPLAGEYFPVYFSTEPKTSAVYGLDYWTYPERRTVLERARDDDQVVVLRTRLYETRHGTIPYGVMVAVPVYAKGTSRTSVADRRRNLNGFVIGIFDLPQLVKTVRSASQALSAVAIDVYPPQTTAEAALETTAVPDFSSHGSQTGVKTGAPWWTTLKIGDTSWRLRAAPISSGLRIDHHAGALALFGAGVVTTIFLAIYLGLASRNSLQLSLANRRVLELAQTDRLTGLRNRSFFLGALQEITIGAGSSGYAVLLLDLDRFKNVNDSLGHAAGDELLRLVALRLRSTLRDGDVVARLGGDEFAVILAGGAEMHKLSLDLARRISKLIAEPFELLGQRVEIGTSIGIALSPEHGTDQEQLLKKADLALYRSKSAGRDCYTVYDEAMSAELEARNTLESDLREAITLGQFEVHYQPFYNVETRRRRGVEALVRWRHPVKGLIPPDQFIPLAESTGLIVPLGEWVIARACYDAAAWADDIKVAVNLSPVQFKQAELFDVIQQILMKSRLRPQRLEIEITESVLLEQAAENHSFIDKLKSIGISLALDDFGTGYSSLRSLTAFPFDKIKIDKSFVANLSEHQGSSAIISSVVTLARGLGMSITAEGVETPEQFDHLRSLGVNFAQGYLLGRPMPASQLDAHFRNDYAKRNAA